MERPRFHLAFPVTDLTSARAFYVEVLGCGVGREDPAWIDFDLYGHQIVAHLAPPEPQAHSHVVDGKQIPVRHFGLVLTWEHWHELAASLQARGVSFLVEPGIRFIGQPGEQATLFIADPSGNAIEFKSFRDIGQLFAR